MAELNLRFAGIPVNETVTLRAQDGTNDEQVTVNNYRRPGAVTALPRLSDCFDGDTITVDVTGLSSITNYDFREVGGSSLQNGAGATFNTTGRGGDWIECVVTADGTDYTSPPIMVYANGMMASNDADDVAIVALVPHDEVTHIASANGDWSDPANWQDNEVPKHGAKVLIPHGVSMTYDVSEKVRLDTVRVDGTLTWALDQDTKMLAETVIGTRGSSILIGTSNANRLPSAYTAQIIVSGKDYSQESFDPSDINSGSFASTLGWGRGIISQGTWRMWGAETTPWGYAEPIASGATSLTMITAPTNWNVGDVLCIGATSIEYGTAQHQKPLATEDEYVTITGISNEGRTFHWSGGLTYDHNNQLATSSRIDLYPVVMKRGGRNISIESEVTDDTARRGHTACVHRFAIMDWWDAQFIGLGRTDKADYAGVIKDGSFRRSNNGPESVVEGALTNRSNLMSRYPIHIHHCGFGRGADTAIVNGCYVEGALAWAMVHHASEARMDNNVMHLFKGAGMVSESGNETGSWVGNLAITCTGGIGTDYSQNPKNTGQARFKQGDRFHEGFGFAFFGRAMRTNRNVAVSCGWGHVWFHRANNGAVDRVVRPVALARSNIAFADIGKGSVANESAGGANTQFDEFPYVDYPINHATDIEAIACVGGIFVSKDRPQQGHDINIHFKNPRVWGGANSGIMLEYVRAYLVEGADVVAGAQGGQMTGLSALGNTYQIGFKDCRVEGCGRFGMRFAGNVDNALNSHDQHDTVTNPRHYALGVDFIDCGTDFGYVVPAGATKLGPDVTRIREDWRNDEFDRFAEPSENHAQIIAQWDGSSVINLATPSDGTKSDELSTGTIYPSTSFGDDVFPVTSGRISAIAANDGYWTHDGKNVLQVPVVVSDRTSARWVKKRKLIECTGSMAGYTNNGALAHTATPVTANDITAIVAPNGSVTINVPSASSAAGGNGSIGLDADHGKIVFEHGDVTVNYATDEITYRPDAGYEGTDFGYIPLVSAGQYKVVRLDVLIAASDTGIVAPVVGTHFAATGGSGLIDITLDTPPATSNRRIMLVQYRIDGGSWRRLCHKWVQATHRITVEGDGAALAAGSRNVSIRVLTDYDWTFSPASAADTVTVS